MRAKRSIAAIVATIAFAGVARATAEAGRAWVEVSPPEATVGDVLALEVRVEVPSGADAVLPDPEASLGPFEVRSGSWLDVEEENGARRWTWRGTIAAYETGTLEVPPMRVEVSGPDGPERLTTEAVRVTIRSVLPPDAGGRNEVSLADLKPPATIAPDYGPAGIAVLALLSLLALSAVLWWLHRRYASRLAAVPAPTDPFHRVPPHVWVYSELQKLLDARLAEEGRVGPFFSELSRIVKTYLGGRYRIDLMERTTEEVVPLLDPAGVPREAARMARTLLELCDRVKFAREMPEAAACREAVDEAYRIADATRPRETAAIEDERGAA